jgi:hypothetical protein
MQYAFDYECYRITPQKNVLFLSVTFLCSWSCFSSWASRIPIIKNTLHIGDAELGTLLLANASRTNIHNDSYWETNQSVWKQSDY